MSVDVYVADSKRKARVITLEEVEDYGGGGAHNNLPPYYALCYIMKA